MVAPRLQPPPRIELVVSGAGAGAYGSDKALQAFLEVLCARRPPAASAGRRSRLATTATPPPGTPGNSTRSTATTSGCWAKARTCGRNFSRSSTRVRRQASGKSVEPYRATSYDEVIGRFDLPLLPPPKSARGRCYEGPKWTGYEVVLDVLARRVRLRRAAGAQGHQAGRAAAGRRLPARPGGPADGHVPGDSPRLSRFRRPAGRAGFVTFAPQNLYLFGDRFRTLQRKANPIEKTLFSIIVPQHQQIVDWLGGLPFVDPAADRLLRAVVRRQDGDARAAAGDRLLHVDLLGRFQRMGLEERLHPGPVSYVWTGEYEIFEFDLGSTFNYAEMAALIAPRPFMVERGHFDGVAPDETVGYEFAKVRFLYEAKLGLGDRCRIEWFVGPHTIHGQGTFDFLHKHLKWPKPAGGP